MFPAPASLFRSRPLYCRGTLFDVQTLKYCPHSFEVHKASSIPSRHILQLLYYSRMLTVTVIPPQISAISVGFLSKGFGSTVARN
ncbi:hypothetical protein EJ05DRAFT_480160 [Pseudovirgaria hyperparasitica]|uniref:Uncharacterized protein n=1 Tax=Pseudovirgaria hyperparasitica TaxID=470096 RepID=A0A6A6VVD1_9PEZI|nr:uncharacterized protein EJ05DRAFT_480160 [Pseudovirgaria hyperparasitica]KAF2753684.1 hypothetical protein EJ05DRAFT_480160 [Pseudovirgaria hyperparasitica]